MLNTQVVDIPKSSSENSRIKQGTTGANGDPKWRHDITGLRALAVLPVLIFHAFPFLIPSGYFGVDIFFVISGYLISGIIFRGLQTGKFSYLEFYRRRIKRIIPNLLLVLLAVLILGWFIMTAKEYRALSFDLRASSFFYQNLHLIRGRGYWDESSTLLPLLHLWSLSIEEQFYIVFPLICAFLWRFKSKKLLGGFVVLFTVYSFCSCMHAHIPERAFYWPINRFWELGAGILISYVECFKIWDFKSISLRWRQLMSSVGFVLVVYAMISHTAVHPSFKTLMPVIGTMLIIAAGKECFINRLLSLRPLVFIGLISYSLYLWHWPLLAYLRLNSGNVSQLQLVLALLATLLISTVIYYAVENPLRHSSWHFGRVGVSSVLLMLLIAFTIVQTQICKIDAHYPRAVTLKWSQFLKDTRRRVDFNKCEQTKIADLNIVSFPTHAQPEILMIGDSHAEQYYYRMQKLSSQYGIDSGILSVWINGGWMATISKLDNLLETSKIKSIILASKWGQIDEDGVNYKTVALKKYQELKAKYPDVNFYAVLDAPWDGGDAYYDRGTFDITTHLHRLFMTPDDVRHLVIDYPTQDSWKEGNTTVKEMLGNIATIIDIESIVCPNKKCDIGERYRDDDHLKPRWLEDHGTWLDVAFEEQRARDLKKD